MLFVSSYLTLLLFLSVFALSSTSLSILSSRKATTHTTKLRMSLLPTSLLDASIMVSNVINSKTFFLSDTSISEEDILDVSGEVSNLPNPLYAVGIGALIFLGSAVLQFSLGDLTKEEGQARVRDFLQTKRDTERKRGYFD